MPQMVVHAVPGRLVGRSGPMRGFYGYEETQGADADHSVPNGRAYVVKPAGDVVEALIDGNGDAYPMLELIRRALRSGDLSLSSSLPSTGGANTQTGQAAEDSEG